MSWRTSGSSADPPDRTPATGGLPRDLVSGLADLGVVPGDLLGYGTASTVVVHAVGRDDAPLVVKLLRDRPGVVDGHDLLTFRRKRDQLALLRHRAPSLAARHAPILHHVEGDGWAAQVLPFVSGSDALAPARAGDPEGTRRALGLVLDDLIDLGYGVEAGAQDATGYLDSAHFDRVSRRIRHLAGAVPDEALFGRGLVVNGAPCRSVATLLARVSTNPGARARLVPGGLSLPVHGDLNTRNIVMSGPGGTPGYRLVDPRGTLDPLDVAYDLGKLLLSATLWDPVLRGGVLVRRAPDRDGRPGVLVRLRAGAAAPHRARRDGVAAVLAALARPSVVALLGRSPDGMARLAFTHAVHLIAEAACRVADGGSAHAVAFLSAGLLALDDLVRQLDAGTSVDLAGHLEVLGSIDP